MTAGRGRLPIAVLISGRGSNMAAIAAACRSGAIDARVAVVIADDGAAPGIELAQQLQLPTRIVAAGRLPERDAFEAALAEAIDASGAELVALAGFMRILSPAFAQRYAGRMLNIHPSLLPKYRGLHTHRRVLAAGEREHGVSVHFVTAELDGGPLICQGRLAVRPGDSEATLRSRVQAIEHRIYPRIIGLIAAGRLRLQGDTPLLDGQVLGTPLLENEVHGADEASR